MPTRAWAKEAIFPVERFAGAADRGIEMRSTGEVMASGETVVAAYRRALQAAGRARAVSTLEPSLQDVARARPPTGGPVSRARAASVGAPPAQA